MFIEESTETNNYTKKWLNILNNSSSEISGFCWFWKLFSSACFSNLAFKLVPVDYLQTWYYEYGWISGANINGPFVDNQTISLEKVKG